MITTIRIDPDDELPVILERLPARGACVLALPPHARALSGVISAKLLARRADTLGTRLVIVSDASTEVAHLRAAGLTIAETVDEAHRLLSDTDVNDEDTEDKPAVVSRPSPRPVLPTGRDEQADDEDADGDAVHLAPTTPLRLASHAAGTPTKSATPPDEADGRPTVRFVAGGRPTSTAPAGPDDADNGALPGKGGDGAGAPAIRGHSGSARLTRSGTARVSATARASATAAASGAPTVRMQHHRPAHGARRHGPLVRLGIPIAILLLLVLVLAWGVSRIAAIFAPSATVTLQLRPATITGRTLVQTYDVRRPPKKINGRVPVYVVEEPAHATVPVPVHGMQTLPGNSATGDLQIANLSTQPVVVPAGTGFTALAGAQLTAARTFITLANATVPAARVTFDGRRNGITSVPIRATIGGAAGNVPALAIQAVPPAYADVLQVENPKPTTGGTDFHQRVVRPADLGPRAASLFGALQLLAQQHIARKYGDIEQHALWSAKSPVTPVLSPDRSKAWLTLSIVLHDAYVQRSDLRAASLAALPPHPALVGPRVTWDSTWRPDLSIALTVTGYTIRPLDIPALRHSLGGRSRAEAAAYLRGRGDLTGFNVEVSPPWADHLPTDLSRIQVVPHQPQ